VRIDRTRKLPLTVLLRALGFSSDQEIVDLLGDSKVLRKYSLSPKRSTISWSLEKPNARNNTVNGSLVRI
jgi:DNA-directed RNA polymerase beta subunit